MKAKYPICVNSEPSPQSAMGMFRKPRYWVTVVYDALGIEVSYFHDGREYADGTYKEEKTNEWV